MATLERQGRTLFFTDTGDASHKEGLPIIFVHGWCCNHTFFRSQEEFFQSSHRIIALDNAGHGQSCLPDNAELSIDLFSSDIVALLDQLSIKRALIAGHSMGGLIALETACQAPDRIQAAILVDPAPMLDNQEQKKFQAHIQNQLEEDASTFISRFADTGLFIPADDVTMRQEIISTMSQSAADTAISAWRAIRLFNGEQRLADCSRPLCVISAEFFLNDPTKMQQLNPQLKHCQTLGAGHFNQIFAADQVNLMMAQFIERLSKT